MKRAGIKPTKAGTTAGIVALSVAMLIGSVALLLLRAPLVMLFLYYTPFLIGLAINAFYLYYDGAPALSAVEYEEEGEGTADVAGRLRQLQELRDEELHSEAEFRAKRAEIIKSI